MTRPAVISVLLATLTVLGCEKPPKHAVVLTAGFLSETGDRIPGLSVRRQGTEHGTTLRKEVHFPARAGETVVVELIHRASGWSSSMSFTPGRHLLLFAPPEWRIAEGKFSGRRLPTGAVIPRHVRAPSLLGKGLRMWDGFPVSVVMQPEPMPSGVRQEEADSHSEMVRHSIAYVNDIAGFEVFRYDGAVIGNSPASKKVKITFRGDVGRGILGGTVINERGCLYRTGRGFSCSPRWIGSAEVVLSPNAGVPELKHELLHSVGLNHTCVVPSVMATEFSTSKLRQCGVARLRLGFTEPLRLHRMMSPFDVVALQILREAAAAAIDWSGDSTHLLTVGQ